jgi:hypothetical protein
VAFIYVVATYWISLLGVIPLFPYKRKHLLGCPVCKVEWTLPGKLQTAKAEELVGLFSRFRTGEVGADAYAHEVVAFLNTVPAAQHAFAGQGPSVLRSAATQFEPAARGPAPEPTPATPVTPLTPATRATAPGWYPDPEGAGGQRYWDGEVWVGSAMPFASDQ